jgi:hypothetical protein
MPETQKTHINKSNTEVFVLISIEYDTHKSRYKRALFHSNNGVGELGLFGGPALVQEGRPDDSRQW